MGFQVFVLLCWVTLIFAVRGVVVAKVSAADHECRIRRCSHDGPEIRFPFWIKDKQPERCGYPGFQVFCDRGKTLLPVQYLANTSLQGTQMFFSKNVSVDDIFYESQQMQLYVYSLTNNLTLVSTSTSLPSAPPHFGEVHRDYYPPYYQYDEPNTTILNCSSRIEDTITATLTSLDGKTFPVYCVADYIDTNQITSCTKVFNASLPIFLMQGYNFMTWSVPNCRECEAKGEYCKLMSNITTSNTTICVPKGHRKIKPIAGIIPAGTLIAVSLVILLYYIIRSYRQRKYDELKFEMFLTDYKAMKATRYAYADIKKITSNFSEELGQGGYGSVYKGQITKEIIVAVKVLKSDPKANGEDFINEVGTIGRIYHVNVVRLVGYCADGCNRALVYEFQPNNSLEKFTYSGKKQQNNFLGWKKMQEIALGIAKGIEYLHQGCAQQILHFDIKPHNILLDQNFNPKISDFGLAKLCSKDQSIVSMTMARGTIGYIAPEVFSRNFGKVSCKSDVYSFGMLLLEMVGARDTNAVENSSETYFPEWIFHRLEEGGEVAIQIEKKEDSNITKKLTIVGLWCIGWHPVDRPSMKHVIHMLESEQCPQMPPNPFRSSNVRSFTNDLQVISESE
ncbi:Non-specific serine/threonine protein kinase [Heracleum sosnowskyi]|uniref:non-specific serine/threonine protein kinase n=1 Tax=Heracleum sosnowskyi TaxID=360622 RepID=A0AAD8MYC7_9APIA|nr:Non-specific serine/threonine protein kinase [Heracleum sosnowskyi]